MFSSSGAPERAERTRSGAEQGLSILAAGLKFTGELETDGIVKIEGHVEGCVRAKGQVLVAKGGVVVGNIYTADAIIGGQVDGEIFADRRVEVQATCSIMGDINTPKITVQDGGKINGSIRMGQSKKGDQTKPAKSGKPQMEVVGAKKADFTIEATAAASGG